MWKSPRRRSRSKQSLRLHRNRSTAASCSSSSAPRATSPLAQVPAPPLEGARHRAAEVTVADTRNQLEVRMRASIAGRQMPTINGMVDTRPGGGHGHTTA